MNNIPPITTTTPAASSTPTEPVKPKKSLFNDDIHATLPNKHTPRTSAARENNSPSQPLLYRGALSNYPPALTYGRPNNVSQENDTLKSKVNDLRSKVQDLTQLVKRKNEFIHELNNSYHLAADKLIKKELERIDQEQEVLILKKLVVGANQHIDQLNIEHEVQKMVNFQLTEQVSQLEDQLKVQKKINALLAEQITQLNQETNPHKKINYSLIMPKENTSNTQPLTVPDEEFKQLTNPLRTKPNR